jgi:hypothetical protein
MFYKILYSIFFTICIAVNVQILMRGNAPDAAMNYLHIVAYVTCWASILWNFKYNRILYCIAALYPIATHAAMLTRMTADNPWFWAFVATISLLFLGNVYLRNKYIIPKRDPSV